MKQIILASGSPRRKEILEMFDVSFEIKTSQIEEKVFDGDLPEQAVMALAFEKGFDVASESDSGSIVIAADTIVFKDDILGKPKDEKDAFMMLKKLSGVEHEVYTGIAVIEACSDYKIVDYVKTKVYFKELSESTIRTYIESGEVWGKAGAYAIQGLGSTLVERIEGDFYNVVGLPASKLEDILVKYFDMSLLKGINTNEA